MQPQQQNLQEDVTVMVEGRIVYTVGDLFKGDLAKQYGTQTPKLNKQNQQYNEYGFGLAVPKSAFQHVGKNQPGAIWTAMHMVAYRMFPNRQINPKFHMKYKDGDTGVLDNGTQVNTKQGYPGNLVFSFKTTIAPKFWAYDAATQKYVLINEGIKCGDYVRVQCSIGLNAGTNAGLYLSPLSVLFVREGEAIINAPSGEQIFGQAPQGVQGMPTASSAFGHAGQQQFGPPQQSAIPQFGQQQAAPAPQGFAPPMHQPAQQQAVQPNYGVLPQIHQPQYQQPMGNAPSPQVTFPQNGYGQQVLNPNGPMNYGPGVQQPVHPSNNMTPAAPNFAPQAQQQPMPPGMPIPGFQQ